MYLTGPVTYIKLQ